MRPCLAELVFKGLGLRVWCLNLGLSVICVIRAQAVSMRPCLARETEGGET